MLIFFTEQNTIQMNYPNIKQSDKFTYFCSDKNMSNETEKMARFVLLKSAKYQTPSECSPAKWLTFSGEGVH